MEKLNQFASEYLLNDSEELHNIHKHYSTLDKDSTVDILSLNLLSNDKKLEFLYNFLSKFNELAVKKNQFEYIYYITSVYRKACEAKGISMTKLLEQESVIVVSSNANSASSKGEMPNDDSLDIVVHKPLLNKKRYFNVIDNTIYINGNKKLRSSYFRGVSKNGKKWQVMLMHKRKYYLGGYLTEEEAGRVYDSYAIFFFKEKAKTNFIYTEEEKREIYSSMMKAKSKDFIN